MEPYYWPSFICLEIKYFKIWLNWLQPPRGHDNTIYLQFIRFQYTGYKLMLTTTVTDKQFHMMVTVNLTSMHNHFLVMKARLNTLISVYCCGWLWRFLSTSNSYVNSFYEILNWTSSFMLWLVVWVRPLI